MLQIFKNIHLLRSQAPKQISDQLVRNFAKSSSYQNHAALHERERMRFTKKQANVQIVEQLYFPDHSTLKINEFIQEKREQQVAKNPAAQSLGKVELTPEDMKYIESLSSQGVNEEVNSKSFFFPESKEEMSKLIAHTDINDKLLKFYMKHHRQCGKQQIFELLAKLEDNFRKEDEVRTRELEKHKAKTRRLQEINPDIEVKFGAIFLTREETLKHSGFQFLVKSINFKAEKEIYQAYTVFELYHSLLRFDPRAHEQIDTVFLKMFEKNIGKYDIFTIAKYINFLQHWAEIQMPLKHAKGLMRLAANALNSKDFSKITKKEILAIVIPLKKIGIIPDDTLMFRLEPYILKYLKEFEPNKLADIYTTYLRFRKGSSAFMDFLINALLLNLRKINLSYVKTIMTMSFPKLTYRSDLPYPELRRKAAKELMKKIKTWDLTNTDLLEVTRAFVVAGIGEENYYEMLSVEFMKRISILEPAAFVEIYNLLAISGIKSEALVYGCNRRLEEFLNEMQETFRAEIKGLLDAGDGKEEATENDLLPKDVKLNIYEKKFVQEFTQLVKALWSYSFFIVKSKKFDFVDIDLWNRGVKELNDMIKKIKGFGGLVPFSRVKMEMLYQMNHFSRIHGKHSLSVNIQGLNDANLMFSDVKDPLPLSYEVKLFLLEKKYFMKKYSNVIAKFPKNKDYQYKFDLENKAKNTVAHIFVNSAVDFLRSSDTKDIRPKGYLETRRHFLELLDAQYIEIGFDKFVKEIYNVRKMKGGYFEEYLKKHVELPEAVLEEEDAEKANEMWEKIQVLRAKIPETSLAALEQEFTMELQDKKLGDYFKDFEQGKIQAAAEEVENDDVYIDSESEDEVVAAK